MHKKKKPTSTLFLIFSIFVFLCAVINFAGGHIGAAIGGLGAGFFYLSFFLVDREEGQKRKEGKQ